MIESLVRRAPWWTPCDGAHPAQPAHAVLTVLNSSAVDSWSEQFCKRDSVEWRMN